MIGLGTGTGVYRGYRYHIHEHSEAPHPFEEWEDLKERFEADQCSPEELDMIAGYENGGGVHYFTIDGIDLERWGSYYYGTTHVHSGLMYDIMTEIDSEIKGDN